MVPLTSYFVDQSNQCNGSSELQCFNPKNWVVFTHSFLQCVQSRPFPRPRNKPRHQLALPPSLPASLPIPHQKPRPVSSLKSVRPLTGERNDKRKGSYSHRVSWELGPANMTTNLIGFYWPKHASLRGISYMAYCIGSWQVCTCVLL